jgi:hypothetical protein
MANIQLWSIRSNKPVQLSRGLISLEKELEDWIEHDPRLVNPDLLIVGRQLHVEAGILDLLALDRLGNYWAIIEVKRGNIRRETISQAVDYASCLHDMSEPDLRHSVENYLERKGSNLNEFLKDQDLDVSVFNHENRNLAIYVVGSGKDPHLERMANFLRKSGVQVNVVTFETFEDDNGNWSLIRQIEDLEQKTIIKNDTPPNPSTSLTPEVKHVFDLANKNGIGEAFQSIFETAIKYDLFPRPYSQSIMYTPPTDRRRCLIYAPAVRKNGQYAFYIVPEAFSEFYPIGTVRAVSILGLGGYWKATPENAQKLAKRLDKLFGIIAANMKGNS